MNVKAFSIKESTKNSLEIMEDFERDYKKALKDIKSNVCMLYENTYN
jgi:hypothetical protein